MYNNYFKRLIDVIGSVILLPVTFLSFLFIGTLIKLEDKGPVFFKGKRVGKNGQLFSMYKFRSMKVNAPDYRNKDGSTFNSENDSRVTKIGRIIRKTSLDELPQLINVLTGDMSFVGPRPDTPEALKIYSDAEKTKLQVKPGITGYNQAYFRNSISQEEKFKNDIFYVKNMSFLFDIKIILKTLQSVIFRKNINNREG